MIDKIEMVDVEAFEYTATPLTSLKEIRLFAKKLNEVIDAVNSIEGALSSLIRYFRSVESHR